MQKTVLCLLVLFVFFLSLASGQEDENVEKIKNSLESAKISFDFVDMPFQKAIQFIRESSKINILIDPKVVQSLEIEKTKITLQVKDFPLKDALKLILSLYNLWYTVANGVILITSKDSPLLTPPSYAVLYDLNMISLDTQISRILARQLRDGTWLPYSLPEKTELFARTEVRLDESFRVHAALGDLIRGNIARYSWEKGPYSITNTSHGLLVTQDASGHQQVSLFLQQLRAFSSPPVHIELWCIEVGNAVLASAQLYQASTVEDKTLALLEEEVKSGKARAIVQTKSVAANRRLIPIVNREKENRQCIFAIRPTVYPNREVLLEIGAVMGEIMAFQDESLEKTEFYNLGTSFLLSSGQTTTISIAPLSENRSILTMARVAVDSWEPVVKPVEKEPEPPVEIRKKLAQQKVSMNFHKAPLTEVVNFITNKTGVNIVIHPDVYMEMEVLKEEEQALDMVVSDLNCENLLDLVVQMKQLTYLIFHNVVIIAKKANRPACTLRLYDVRDIRLRPEYEFFDTGKRKPTPFYFDSGALLTFIYSYSTPDQDMLLDIIKNNIEPRTWEGFETASLDNFGDIFLVRQTSDGHAKVSQFIDQLRKLHRKERRLITVWAFLAPKDKPPVTMSLIGASNCQKVFLKSGILYMGNTARDQDKRSDEIESFTSDSLTDKIEKREGIAISVTPLLVDKDTIEVVLQWDSWGGHGAERRWTVSIRNGTTVPIDVIPGESEDLTLFLGARYMQDR